jgi:hypothetical protein
VAAPRRRSRITAMFVSLQDSQKTKTGAPVTVAGHVRVRVFIFKVTEPNSIPGRIYSITHWQPHSDVNRTHPHPHHTPLVNGLQHLCARN